MIRQLIFKSFLLGENVSSLYENALSFFLSKKTKRYTEREREREGEVKMFISSHSACSSCPSEWCFYHGCPWWVLSWKGSGAFFAHYLTNEALIGALKGKAVLKLFKVFKRYRKALKMLLIWVNLKWIFLFKVLPSLFVFCWLVI